MKWSGFLGYYKGDFSEAGNALKSLTEIIVVPLPSPPYTRTVCRIALLLLTGLSIHMLIRILLQCTIIEVDETCHMHLSTESVWRSLAFSSSSAYIRVKPSVAPVLLLTTCVTSGMTLNHYGPLCATISNMTSKFPSPLDTLSFSPPPSLGQSVACRWLLDSSMDNIF